MSFRKKENYNFSSTCKTIKCLASNGTKPKKISVFSELAGMSSSTFQFIAHTLLNLFSTT